VPDAAMACKWSHEFTQQSSQTQTDDAWSNEFLQSGISDWITYIF